MYGFSVCSAHFLCVWIYVLSLTHLWVRPLGFSVSVFVVALTARSIVYTRWRRSNARFPLWCLRGLLSPAAFFNTSIRCQWDGQTYFLLVCGSFREEDACLCLHVLCVGHAMIEIVMCALADFTVPPLSSVIPQTSVEKTHPEKRGKSCLTAKKKSTHEAPHAYYIYKKNRQSFSSFGIKSAIFFFFLKRKMV